MISPVIFSLSAIVCSAFCRSITLPVFALCIFDILVYVPYAEHHGAHYAAAHRRNDRHHHHRTGESRGGGGDDEVAIVDGSANLHERLDEVVFGDGAAGTADDGPFGHRCGRSHVRAFAHFALFTLVGYTLSHTSRYPPLLDAVYVGADTAYCAKIALGIAVYHVALVPLLFSPHDTAAAVGAAALLAVWSVLFYRLVVIDGVRWQTRHSVRAFAASLFALLSFTALAHTCLRALLLAVFEFSHSTTGAGGVPERVPPVVPVGGAVDDYVALAIAAVDVALVLAVRTGTCAMGNVRARRPPMCAKLYANDKHLAYVNRQWMGFSLRAPRVPRSSVAPSAVPPPQARRLGCVRSFASVLLSAATCVCRPLLRVFCFCSADGGGGDVESDDGGGGDGDDSVDEASAQRRRHGQYHFDASPRSDGTGFERVNVVRSGGGGGGGGTAPHDRPRDAPNHAADRTRREREVHAVPQVVAHGTRAAPSTAATAAAATRDPSSYVDTAPPLAAANVAEQRRAARATRQRDSAIDRRATNSETQRRHRPAAASAAAAPAAPKHGHETGQTAVRAPQPRPPAAIANDATSSSVQPQAALDATHARTVAPKPAKSRRDARPTPLTPLVGTKSPSAGKSPKGAAVHATPPASVRKHPERRRPSTAAATTTTTAPLPVAVAVSDDSSSTSTSDSTAAAAAAAAASVSHTVIF